MATGIKIVGMLSSIYRWQLVLQAGQRAPLHAFLREVVDRIETTRSRRGVRWSLDVDPLEML